MGGPGVVRRAIHEAHLQRVIERTRELDPHELLSNLRRTWYVMEMGKSKKHITQATKDRQRQEFEDAVIAYGRTLQALRRAANKRKKDVSDKVV